MDLALVKAVGDRRWSRSGRSARRPRLVLEPVESRARTRTQAVTERADDMDTLGALSRFEAAVNNQLLLTGDPAVESAGQALLHALEPATRQLALELAEQAATELAAQLPDHDVEVVIRGGEPVLQVSGRDDAEDVPGEDYEARITLRLPPTLKSLVEEAAGSAGDSVNNWVVKTLSGNAGRRPRPGRRVTGTVRT